MIKFEHSVFALPFALTGALLAFRESRFDARGFGYKLLWIVVAMVGARSAAMAFNRILDADIDARNPRTRMRHIPAGILSTRFAWGFVLVSALVFLLAARALNPLCLQTCAGRVGRRVLLFVYETLHLVFTPDSRVFTRDRAGGGVDRGARIARSADSVAYRRGDVLDRRLRHHLLVPGLRIRFDAGLFSLPRRFGMAGALWIARLLHIAMIACLWRCCRPHSDLGWLSWAGIGAIVRAAAL